MIAPAPIVRPRSARVEGRDIVDLPMECTATDCAPSVPVPGQLRVVQEITEDLTALSIENSLVDVAALVDPKPERYG